MSHFTEIQTKIFIREILLTVLKQLGYNIDEKTTKLEGYANNNTQVDIQVRLENSYNIGFVLTNDGSYNIISDWYGVRNINQKKFTRSVMQNYSLELIRQEMKRKGYRVIEQKNLEDNSIKVVVRRW